MQLTSLLGIAKNKSPIEFIKTFKNDEKLEKDIKCINTRLDKYENFMCILEKILNDRFKIKLNLENFNDNPRNRYYERKSLPECKHRTFHNTMGNMNVAIADSENYAKNETVEKLETTIIYIKELLNEQIAKMATNTINPDNIKKMMERIKALEENYVTMKNNLHITNQRAEITNNSLKELDEKVGIRY